MAMKPPLGNTGNIPQQALPKFLVADDNVVEIIPMSPCASLTVTIPGYLVDELCATWLGNKKKKLDIIRTVNKTKNQA